MLFKIKIESSEIMKKLKLNSKEFILVTAHRKENVDDPSTFQSILSGLGLIKEKIKDKSCLSNAS